jgi:hypothetical protein
MGNQGTDPSKTWLRELEEQAVLDRQRPYVYFGAVGVMLAALLIWIAEPSEAMMKIAVGLFCFGLVMAIIVGRQKLLFKLIEIALVFGLQQAFLYFCNVEVASTNDHAIMVDRDLVSACASNHSCLATSASRSRPMDNRSRARI